MDVGSDVRRRGARVTAPVLACVIIRPQSDLQFRIDGSGGFSGSVAADATGPTLEVPDGLGGPSSAIAGQVYGGGNHHAAELLVRAITDALT